MKTFRLALEWFENPDHVPFILGRELGWFADAGLDLELIEPTEHLDAAAMFDRGELDAAITEPIHLLADRAAGRRLSGFARFLHTDGGVLYFQGRGIERPRDMAGVRVQYPGAPGPGGPAIVSTMIAADGGDYAPETLTPINNGFHHTDALIEDRADVATLAFYNFEVIEARHRGYPAALFSLRDWGVPDFCQLILVAPEDRLEDDAYRQLCRVLSRGIAMIKQAPDEAEAIYRRHTGDDSELGRALYRATAACFTYDMGMSEGYYRDLARWMEATGQIAADGPIPGVWDHRPSARPLPRQVALSHRHA